jgi:predicted ABC-type ATPase
MPAIYILAGPNGTGKTTYYTTAIEEGFIDATLPFINVDLICRDQLGGYSEENTVKAEQIVRERIKSHIERSESFMIESNLAQQADYDWIQRMNAAGYETHLFFLCTSLVDINIQRVEKESTRRRALYS